MTTAHDGGPAEHELDLVLLGATGFAGRLTAAHLTRSAPPGARIALAGRSGERLRALRDELGPAASAWELRTVDVTSRPAIERLAAQTRVLATTVGPYARWGLPVVDACARLGTHYADLTG
ncbi:MAG: saccharopine dehydrogenase NADP-binding domain-containing protein, partial [Janthinobacterium lividum]